MAWASCQRAAEEGAQDTQLQGSLVDIKWGQRDPMRNLHQRGKERRFHRIAFAPTLLSLPLLFGQV